MNRTAFRAALLLALAALAACNTVKGVGRDIGAAGDAVESAAEKTRRAISE